MSQTAIVERLRHRAAELGKGEMPYGLLLDAANEIEQAEGYAERLAVSLWEQHYLAEAPDWKPLTGDLLGILTQIDNLTANLKR